MTRRHKVALLIGVALLGVALGSCARVQSHYKLPDLAAADAAFLPTLEAVIAAFSSSTAASDSPGALA